MDEVTDGDGLAEVGHFRDPFPDVVVERELALLREHRDGERGELLGDGGGVEGGGGRDWHVVLEACHPVAFREDGAAAVYDGDCATGRVAFVEAREDRIDSRVHRPLSVERRGSGNC